MPLLLAAALLLTAEPARLTLQHQNGEGCPDEAWLKLNVAARLGYSPFVDAAPTKAATKLECGAGGCFGQLELSRPGESPRRRTLTAAKGQCRELGESLALALALAVDPQLLTRAPPPPAPPAVTVPEPVPAPKPEPAAPVVLVEAPKEPERHLQVHFQGVLAGHGSLGVSPFPTYGGAVALGLRLEWFGLLLEGRADGPQSVNVTGGRVTSSVLMGSLLPCGHYKGLGICLMASAGELQVSGQLPVSRRESSPLVLVGGRLLYEWMFLPWLGLHLHLSVEGVVTRTTVVANDGPVWVTAQVAGDAGGGLVLVF